LGLAKGLGFLFGYHWWKDFFSCVSRISWFPFGSPMPTAPAKKENLFINLACNLAIPFLVLSKLSGETRLGPVWALVVALSFPLGYFVHDFIQRRQANFIAILGFAGVLLTGGFALLHLNSFWFAVKEAAVPLAIGTVLLLSAGSKRPLVRTFIYNDQVIDTAKVDEALDARAARPAFNRLMRQCTYLVAASFLVSCVLNFVLASWLLIAEPGSEEFNGQIARMNVLSWAVIIPPSLGMMMFALWRLLGGIKRITGLELDAIFKTPEEKTKK
jgi:hypothetical protein